MYDGTKSTLERALELARGGTVASIAQLRRKLRAEQHEAVEMNTSGKSIQAQLKAAIAEARKPR